MEWRLDPEALVPAWQPAEPRTDRVLAFSTRRGGLGQPPFDTLNLGLSSGDDPAIVAANRRRLLERLGLAPAGLVTAGQVHGSDIRTVAAPGHQASCDALVTLTPGLALAVATADCMGLLYSAPGAVAVAHAGWRGAAAGLPAATLRALCAAAGTGPGAVRVALGPCARPCCYQVGPEVAAQFPAAAVVRADGDLRLDLAAAARAQLLDAGLPPGAFEDTGACTICGRDWYFSHRRDGARTGRQWGIAALRP